MELTQIAPQLQAEVEALIARSPDHKPDDVGAALADACRQLRTAWLKRRRSEHSAALKMAAQQGDAAGMAAHQMALNAVADELRRLAGPPR